MRKDLDRDLQHIGLPTACAVIYAKVMGRAPSSDPQEMQRVLESVAHAVSNVVTVYSRDAAAGLPTPIAAFDLAQGKFARGAHAFLLKNGKELRRLTVQRTDLRTAILVFQSAHVSFRSPRAG